MLVLQRNNFKAFPASRRVRYRREMLCCPGLCRVGAAGTAGRDARFASVGSAELVPGEPFLPAGRAPRQLSMHLRGCHTLISWYQTSAGSL